MYPRSAQAFKRSLCTYVICALQITCTILHAYGTSNFVRLKLVSVAEPVGEWLTWSAPAPRKTRFSHDMDITVFVNEGVLIAWP